MESFDFWYSCSGFELLVGNQEERDIGRYIVNGLSLWPPRQKQTGLSFQDAVQKSRRKRWQQ